MPTSRFICGVGKGLVYSSETDAPLEQLVSKRTTDTLRSTEVRKMASAERDERVAQTALEKFFHTVPWEMKWDTVR